MNRKIIREDVIRAPFSAFASATLLYMSAEYADYYIRGSKWSLGISVICGLLAIMEAHKVGTRVERILRLR